MFIFFLLTISTDCLRTLKDLPIFPSLGLLPSFLSPLTHRSQSLHLLTPYLVQGYVSRRAQWLMNPVLTSKIALVHSPCKSLICNSLVGKPFHAKLVRRSTLPFGNYGRWERCTRTCAAQGMERIYDVMRKWE